MICLSIIEFPHWMQENFKVKEGARILRDASLPRPDNSSNNNRTTTEQQPKQLTQILSSHYPVILSLCPFLCYQGSLLLFHSPPSLSRPSHLKPSPYFILDRLLSFFEQGANFTFIQELTILYRLPHL